ncbi:MAG: PHB depolymerase family esterase [Pseudomonadota bacterium]
MRSVRAWAAAAVLAVLPPTAGLGNDLPACGGEDVCTIEAGSYHVRAPDGWDGEAPLGVFLFFHGFRSSGLSAVRSGSLQEVFGGAGYLIVAPNGDEWQEGARAWPARDAPGRPWRDDVAFTRAVLADVAQRFPVDDARVVIAGFSAGGSMAWRVACRQADGLAAVISIAGALRRPVPEACGGGPVPALQIHGYSDRTVPLEGRRIRDWHQGDVFETLDLIRRANGCESLPAAVETEGRYWCRDWTGCGSGAPVGFCLHPGGHGLPADWTTLARDWLASLG